MHHTFTTTDAQGVDHKVTIKAIPFDQGNAILMDLGALLGDTGAAAISGGDFAKAFRTLKGSDGAEMIVRLFAAADAHRSRKHETVDPKSGIVESKTQHERLSNEAIRNTVFAANYAEAYEIALEILRFNFAPFLTEAWKKLAGRYGTLITKATGITIPQFPLDPAGTHTEGESE